MRRSSPTPCRRTSGRPLPAIEPAVPSPSRKSPSLSCSGTFLGFLRHLFQIEITVANARMRSCARRAADGDDELIGSRSIRNEELQGKIVRPQALVELVHHRNLDGGAAPAALVGEGEIGLACDGFSELVAEPQRMNEA